MYPIEKYMVFQGRRMRTTGAMIKSVASEYKLGRSRDLACSTHSVQPHTARNRATAGVRRFLATGLVILAVGMVGSARAQHSETAVTCANAVSGAPWQIRIDYDRGTVDSNPARISNTEITWKDAKDGWNYTLDRKSGNLTVIVASATGGNFLYHRCKLEN
jgi:hypothetical protein